MTKPRWGSKPQDTPLHALERALRDVPDQSFFESGGNSHTYREIDAGANQLAHLLVDRGVGAGDRVATMLDNGVDVVLAWLAAGKIGAVWVPINTAFKGEFLRHPLTDSGARVVIAESSYAERVLGLHVHLPDLGTVLVRGDRLPAEQGWPETLALTDATTYPNTGFPLSAAPADLAVVLYTSGTTGPSKGCLLSHNSLCHAARAGVGLVDLEADETIWTCMPMFHTSAMLAVIGALLVQGRVSISPKFSVSRFWEQIEASGARVAKIMASMIPLLAEAPDTDAMRRCRGQLRAVTGNPFPQRYQEIFHDRFGVQYIACNQYATTEAYCVTSVPHGTPTPAGSAGRRNDDFEVILVDDDGREVDAGETGEILYRPNQPHIMSDGYWNRPVETLASRDNMWFHSGDLARFDDEGFLWFVDRKKDYIRHGGENISSWEMERTFIQHPAVREVAFHSVSGELGEDDIKLTIVLHTGISVSEEDIWVWSQDRLPRFAIPRYIEFRDELPKNGVGRVLKYELRNQGRTERTWDVQGSVHAGR